MFNELTNRFNDLELLIEFILNVLNTIYDLNGLKKTITIKLITSACLKSMIIFRSSF